MLCSPDTHSIASRLEGLESTISATTVTLLILLVVTRGLGGFRHSCVVGPGGKSQSICSTNVCENGEIALLKGDEGR